MSGGEGRWIVVEVTTGGAWLVGRHATEEEARRLAEALRRGMRQMGDVREYLVKDNREEAA